jgi:hypothetical protein
MSAAPAAEWMFVYTNDAGRFAAPLRETRSKKYPGRNQAVPSGRRLNLLACGF